MPQFVEKASLFHKLNPYSKWKRGLSPLFQTFFPLQPDFFLNQAAVFRQSQSALRILRRADFFALKQLLGVKLLYKNNF